MEETLTLPEVESVKYDIIYRSPCMVCPFSVLRFTSGEDSTQELLQLEMKDLPHIVLKRVVLPIFGHGRILKILKLKNPVHLCLQLQYEMESTALCSN